MGIFYKESLGYRIPPQSVSPAVSMACIIADMMEDDRLFAKMIMFGVRLPYIERELSRVGYRLPGCDCQCSEDLQ